MYMCLNGIFCCFVIIRGTLSKSYFCASSYKKHDVEKFIDTAQGESRNVE